MQTTLSPKLISQRTYIVLFFFLSFALAWLALAFPILQSYRTPSIRAGQVAERAYRAPQAITFESRVLTEQHRQAAERSVSPVYTAPDIGVARQQLERLRATLAYITSVRSDAYATLEQKLVDLAALGDVSLSQDTAVAILNLTEARWQEVQQEALIVLEKVMSSAIRPEMLPETRQRVPFLVSLALPESQAAIAAELAASFVAPNSQYSESLTQAAIEAARASVAPVSRSFVPGQTIVSQGQVLSEADIEALQMLGLIQPEHRWHDLVSAAVFSGLWLAFSFIYLRRRRALYEGELRGLLMTILLFLFFLVIARLLIPSHTLIPYAFPVAAYAMTIASLLNPEVALICSLPLSALVAYQMPNSLELTLYYALGSLFGVLALGQARRLISFFSAGGAVAVSGMVVILAFRLSLLDSATAESAALAGAALFNGLAAASVTILLQFLLAQLLGVMTPMQLMDLIRPDHPLLELLLREAPGTYQHSLQLANLAERVAESIGADPLLTRVGALYHDIGKVRNPSFFIENQPPGFPNPHDALDPHESARIILRHVPDGLELGRKYRLPARILDFISQHHGTMLTRYQYARAVKAAGGCDDRVDKEQFRYPGPPPQSRETALIMLADACEARMRADNPPDEEALRALIQQVIDNRLSSGQLDNTPLTMHDLKMIREAFVATLRGIYHPRLEYPPLEVMPTPQGSAVSVPDESGIQIKS